MFRHAPALTLTDGLAAVHRAATGARSALALDRTLAERVAHAPLADPAVAWDCAIGQSTVATGRVLANLFYRGLAFHRAPAIGDTLTSTTTVVALKQNRTPSGLAALRVVTRDQHGRTVLDFVRCAMLPLRDRDAATGYDTDMATVAQGSPPPLAPSVAAGWRRSELGGDLAARPAVAGETRALEHFELVDDAAALARVTLNVAAIHLQVDDASPRLVYGGQTIAMAAGQLTRLFPDCLYIFRWQSCDHLAPVREGDGLRTRATVERVRNHGSGWRILDLRCEVDAGRPSVARRALDWRLSAIFA